MGFSVLSQDLLLNFKVAASSSRLLLSLSNRQVASSVQFINNNNSDSKI